MAHFKGKDEFPIIKREDSVPNRLITFSDALATNDYDQWVCFYEDDFKFYRLWENPKSFLPILKKFNGVISPDFSLYWDLPLEWQRFHCFMGRCIASWLIENGVKVIPNIRYGDERSVGFYILGVEPGGSVAMGTLGCIKNKERREKFEEGLSVALTVLKPKNIIVYGSAPDTIFGRYKKQGFNIIVFESKTAKYFKDKKKKG